MKDRHNQPSIGDIPLDKDKMRLLHHLAEVIEVAAVGKFVQIDDSVTRVFLKHIVDKVAPDKPTATGHQDGLCLNHLFSATGRVWRFHGEGGGIHPALPGCIPRWGN